MSATNNAFASLRDAILTEVDYEGLKRLVHSLPVTSITDERFKGLDILQVAILHRNIEAIRLLVPIFSSHPTPANYPYLHLAAWVNSNAAAQVILNDRQLDQVHLIPSVHVQLWASSLRKCGHDINYDEVEIDNGAYSTLTSKDLTRAGDDLTASGQESTVLEKHVASCRDSAAPCRDSIALGNENSCHRFISALDIAAVRGNLRTVRSILSLKCAGKISLCEKAVSMQSFSALKLIIDSGEAVTNDLVDAFKAATFRNLPSCMEVILCSNKEVVRICQSHDIFFSHFHGSRIFEHTREYDNKPGRPFCDLKEATNLLLKYGFDVNFKGYVGNYSLYSFFQSMFHALQLGHPLTDYRDIFKLLLLNGADPWFADVNEDMDPYDRYNWMFSTTPMNISAITALTRLFLENIATSEEYWFEIFSEYFFLILASRPIPRDALNKTLVWFMWMLGRSPIQRNMNLTQFVKALFMEGADLEITVKHSTVHPPESPIQVYFVSILHKLLDFESETRERYEASLRTHLDIALMDLLPTVSNSHITEIRTRISDIFQRQIESEAIPKGLDLEAWTPWTLLDDCLDTAQSQVISLANACRLLIWRAIERDKSKMAKLPVPKSLLLDLFK